MRSILVLALSLLAGALAQFDGTTDLNDNCEELAQPLVIRGRKFFNEATGEYVPIKGVNYYPRPNEGVLALTNSVDYFTDRFRGIWERDIANFVDLGVNAIRIYAVDPSKNHDAFMCALKSAGIYVMVGLSAECENCSIRKDVGAPDCYPGELKQRGQFIIEQFSQYTNLLGFSVSNEASLDVEEGVQFNGPCQKRFLRDMKAFIQVCKRTIRKIPIGIVLADAGFRDVETKYYNCQTRPDDELESYWDVADFIGINSYTHCDGDAGLGDELLGYNELLDDVAGYNLTVPVLLTEFGCVHPTFPTIGSYEAQRTWLQVPVLYSSKFREQFAGGFVFEYSTELAIAENFGATTTTWPFLRYGDRNHGLGYFSPPNCDDISNPCQYTKFPQFNLLASRFATVDTSDEPNLEEYEASLSAPSLGGDSAVSTSSAQSTNLSPPSCPVQFARWTDFKWEADDRTYFDWGCPRRYIIKCPGIADECLTFAPTAIDAAEPTAAPVATTLAVSAVGAVAAMGMAL